MTEPAGEHQAAADGGVYSKDYWDVVFDQLGRRRLFQLALAVLALLYGSAIYAPLLASDRPYVLEAIDYGAYDKARKGLYPSTLGLRSLLKKTPEEYLEGRMEGSTQTYDEALEAELGGLVARLDTLRTYLPEEHHADLSGYAEEARAAVAEAEAGEREAALARAETFKDTAKELRKRFDVPAPSPAGDAPEGDAGEGTIQLVPRKSWPLLEATTAWEVFLMVLWAFVLTWPLWNGIVNRLFLRKNRERIRRLRKPKLVVVLGTSAAAAVVWAVAVGGEMTFHTATYKQDLSSGDIVATRVIFPPVAMGFAETHGSETFRPPTWIALSEMSDEGRYLRGARSRKVDEVTGFEVEAQPVDVRFGEAPLNSGWRHPLGTDSLGRDLLVRALYGGRVSLSVGIVSTALLMVIGVIVGCIAGYFGGRVDLLISRLIEVVICFPVFFLILVVVAFVGPSIINIMVVIGLLRWTGVARLARGEFLRLKELDFVVAARALGLPTARTVFRHMLPNAMGPLLVAGSFSVAAGILNESGLSFLGFGVTLPIPSWGSLVVESKNAAYWWIQVFPGALIFLTVLCYNLVGDAVRDAMDPRMKV